MTGSAGVAVALVQGWFYAATGQVGALVTVISLGRISSIYLLDAVAEIGLAAAWVLARRSE